MNLYRNQNVKYVDADGTIVDAVIEDDPATGTDGSTSARIKLPNGNAIAAYNEDKKTPNTFHVEEATPAIETKPFTPGTGNPSSDKKKAN